jgi:23S rRNA (adenine2503-C2)-methyltransferase
VHTPFEQERSQLMPINKRFKLHEVIQFFREHLSPEQTLFVQYTLIEGVNNSTEHAVALSKLLQGMNVKVNIIPLNPIDPVRFQTPSEDSLTNFTKVLAEAGLRVMIRFSKGRDIQAACGQLVRPKRTTASFGKNLISEHLL